MGADCSAPILMELHVLNLLNHGRNGAANLIGGLLGGGNGLLLGDFLGEVALQQTLQSLAVAGLVTGHLMRQAASVLPLMGRFTLYNAYYSKESQKKQAFL